jgi:hypothetical protein
MIFWIDTTKSNLNANDVGSAVMKKLIAATVLGLSMASAASATVVFSDNFDTEVLGAPQGTLTQWTVTSGTVDVIGPGFYDFYPGNGHYLDLNGTPGAGRIETASLGLTAGSTYRLMFDFGNNANSNGQEELSFGIGDQLYSFAISGAVANLTSFVIDIVFNGGSDDYLFFADTGTLSPNDNGGPILDNVSLAAVPLPAGGLLLIGAIGGLAALRRRSLV